MKKMATKLIRLLSEKKRMENHFGSQAQPQGQPQQQSNNNNAFSHRDLETEELIEDQVRHIDVAEIRMDESIFEACLLKEFVCASSCF